MTERNVLLHSIAATIADYRVDEPSVPTPTPEHIERWVGQFDPEVQPSILHEMDHVLKKTYFSKERVNALLRDLIFNPRLVGSNPNNFWKNIEFLNIQGGGNSQKSLLNLMDENLKTNLMISIDECGSNDTFIYIDDVIYTGSRIKQDLNKWISGTAPRQATVYVVTIATYAGSYDSKGKIEKAIKAANKDIRIKYMCLLPELKNQELENRKFRKNSSDVLWPVKIPDDAAVNNYVEQMGDPPVLRLGGGTGNFVIFSGEAGRQVLEQAFLKAGAHILNICPKLRPTPRPLGHTKLKTLGFGSTIVTYRNCPNNAPLAFWVADDGWFPLFPRKTNTATRSHAALAALAEAFGRKT